jgi:hypothetical protein
MELSAFTPLFCAITGFLAAYLAKQKGYNPYLWFGVGFLFGIFGILAFFLPFSFSRSRKSTRTQAPTTPQPYIAGSTNCFWYYIDHCRQQQGPMSHHALVQEWKKGEIDETTLIWNEDLSDWTELKKVIKYRAPS